MTDKRIQKKLIPLLRIALGTASEPVALTDEDCAFLLNTAKRQSIIPLLWAGLRRQECPEELRRRVDELRVRDFYDYAMREHAFKTLCAAFEEAEIPYLPLKGSVIKDLYPEPWMRTSCDIDILVHEEDLDRALSAIESKTDFIVGERDFHDVSLVNRQVHFELHFSIKENMENIDALLKDVWRYAVKCPDSFRYRLTPEFQIFHILAHMSYHLKRGGLGIRPYLDLWLLRGKTSYDEELLRGMCESCGILTFYEKSCDMLRVWMEGAPCTPELETLETVCFAGAVYSSTEYAGAAVLRESVGLRYLMRRLFVSRAVLEELYPMLRGRPYLLPVCQVRRWLRIFQPKHQTLIRKELRDVQKIEKQDIKEFDSFLKTMGL